MSVKAKKMFLFNERFANIQYQRIFKNDLNINVKLVKITLKVKVSELPV